MKKDQKKIDKFLELLPDDAMKSIFYSLSTSNMLGNAFGNLMEDYFEYMNDYSLSFEDKKIKINYSEFYESFHNLYSFILECFFCPNPTDTFSVLHPDIRTTDPKLYNEFKDKFKDIIKDAEKKYATFRKSVEEYTLKNISEKNNKKEPGTSRFWITQNNDGNYCFDGNTIDISKDTDYAKIFDAVISIKPAGGDIEYSQIKKVCKTKKLNTTNHSVQKALTGKDANLFRFTKGIKQFTNYGTQLFKASSSGKYITFNNKK